MNKEVIFRGIPFKGQFPLKTKFKNEAGVYIIADRKNKITDIDETENLKERMANKKRQGKYLWFYPEENYQNRLQVKNFIRQAWSLA
ncbi:MAG: hypothetical protein ACOXZ1_02500 [Patescibacteria group bacterium]|jgi:1-acyl-sn-glycerol-3-phosphate acyltransferase|nr:hypothetical protein [Patescibacteria group bacterium]